MENKSYWYFHAQDVHKLTFILWFLFFFWSANAVGNKWHHSCAIRSIRNVSFGQRHFFFYPSWVSFTGSMCPVKSLLLSFAAFGWVWAESQLCTVHRSSCWFYQQSCVHAVTPPPPDFNRRCGVSERNYFSPVLFPWFWYRFILVSFSSPGLWFAFQKDSKGRHTGNG